MPIRLRLCALVLVGTAATGCVSFRAASGPLQATLARPQTVRVTRASGARIVLDAARLMGDSLIGEDPWGPRSGAWAVALADVRRVEVHRFDWLKTAALGAGVVAAYGVWAYLTFPGFSGLGAPAGP